MQFSVGALQVLLAAFSLQSSYYCVSAVNLRSVRVKETSPQSRWQPVLGSSLMQGKVDVVKANATGIAPVVPKSHPWAVAPVSAAALPTAAKKPTAAEKQRTAAAWARKEAMEVLLDKEKKAVLVLGAKACLVSLAMCLAIGAIALLIDVMRHCLHLARFRQCQAKVQRAHNAFRSKSGELPICPYCVENLPCKRGANKVSFLCGHRFHVECTNHWFSENTDDQGTHCPICRDVECVFTSALCKGGECGKTGSAAKDSPSSEDTRADETPNVDGAFAFVLENLHRCYPDIINQDCVERWMTCNTETWISELTCPRYNSILRKPSKGK